MALADSKLPVIAIDGPAGAGKSTVARLIADRAGLRILDTGAMYRAVAVKADSLGVPTTSADQLKAIAESIVIGFEGDRGATVLMDGRDVTSEIRTLQIGQAASELSVYPGVRQALVRSQKALIADGGFVLEGRDTTTVVAPKADLKVFLTASIEERARRRWLEIRSRGDDTVRLQDVVRDVVERDHRDYSRADSPLTLAEDAVILETYAMSPPEVTERIVKLLQERGFIPTWVEADWKR